MHLSSRFICWKIKLENGVDLYKCTSVKMVAQYLFQQYFIFTSNQFSIVVFSDVSSKW